jgi:hypothetical protein
MSEEELINKYKSGLSIPDLFKECGIPKSTIRYCLKKNNVLRSNKEGIVLAGKQGKLSTTKGKTRIFNDEWIKNIGIGRKKWGETFAKGITLKKSGYLEHTNGVNKGKHAHIVIMESYLNRKLNKNEVVHHIDGNKQNNCVENLQVMTRSEHSSLHATENLITRERNIYGQFK